MSEGHITDEAQAERELHRTSNRIAAVDIARVLTALIVMYEHLEHYHLASPAGEWLKYCINWVIGTCSPIFFLFAGYFACRNITWKKALHNAWWCFVPYVLWVSVAAFVIWLVAPETWAVRGYPTSLYGVESLATGYQVNLGPVNGPLWFMRDLIFLFLLSPLLYRWSKWLFPLLVLVSVLPGMVPAFESTPAQVLTPYSVGFFTLGCFLRTLSKERQQALLRFHSGFYIAVFFGVSLLFCVPGLVYSNNPGCSLPAECPFLPDWLWGALAPAIDGLWQEGSYWRHWGFVPAIMAIWGLYQTARFIEVHFPRLTKLAVKIAPVTFLTFATHWPIYIYVNSTPLRDTLWPLALPLLVFAGMTLFFVLLKRWGRPLLLPVAHYKLRPDDMPKR